MVSMGFRCALKPYEMSCAGECKLECFNCHFHVYLPELDIARYQCWYDESFLKSSRKRQSTRVHKCMPVLQSKSGFQGIDLMKHIFAMSEPSI